MNPLHIVVPGTPATWQRAVPMKGRASTPESMRKAKRHIASCMRAAVLAARWEMATTAIAVSIRCSRNRKAHIVPDIDNLAKCVLDSGNGILWKDDALVVRLDVEKRDAREWGVDEATDVFVCDAMPMVVKGGGR